MTNTFQSFVGSHQQYHRPYSLEIATNTAIAAGMQTKQAVVNALLLSLLAIALLTLDLLLAEEPPLESAPARLHPVMAVPEHWLTVRSPPSMDWHLTKVESQKA
jgi:hypothetical protein